MIRRVKRAFKDRLRHLKWMDSATRAEAVKKGNFIFKMETNSHLPQVSPVAGLFNAGLGLVIKVPHCCYVLLSDPILPFFGGNFKFKGEDGDRQQHIAKVRDFYHQT